MAAKRELKLQLPTGQLGVDSQLQTDSDVGEKTATPNRWQSVCAAFPEVEFLRMLSFHVC